MYALFQASYFEPKFLAMLGKAFAARHDVARAREVLDSLGQRAKPGNLNDRTAQLVLAGEVALAEGRADSAVKWLTIACATDSSTDNEESLARALAAANSVPAAARAYEALANRRRDWYGWEPEARALTAPLAAGRLFEQLGAHGRARRAYEQMLNQWRDADSDLIDLREARQRLALVSQRSSRALR